MNYTFLVIKKGQFSNNCSKEIKVGRDSDEEDFLTQSFNWHKINIKELSMGTSYPDIYINKNIASHSGVVTV